MIQSTSATQPAVPSPSEGTNLLQATKEIHRAVQWIPRVATAYIAAREDESHMTMAWDKREKFFYGQTFSDYPLRLGFQPGSFSWLLMDDKLNILDKVSGLGISDETVWGWLQKNLLDRQIAVDPLSYHLSYSLPYDSTMATKYSVEKMAALEQFAELRTAAVLVTKAALIFSRPSQFYDEICTWPQNFNTSSTINLLMNGQNHSDITVETGLAIADQMVDEHYLYVCYRNGKAVFNPYELPSLPSGGYWLSKNGWTGAVLPFSKLGEYNMLQLDRGVLFLIGAIETLIYS